MAFKLRRCKGPAGLPLIEIPERGLIAERLSPGEIREADFYDLFRRVNRKGARLLTACPKDKVKRGRCTVPLRVLRIWHDRAALKTILRDCRSGALSERRARMIETILKDIKDQGGPVLEGLFPSAQSLAIFIGRVAMAFLMALVAFRILSPVL
jgi:hypothetical protein